jgi:leucyl aminopeptidase
LQQAGDITGKPNELTSVLGRSGAAAERLLVVGLGKRATADRARLRDAAAVAARAVTGKQRRRVACALPENLPGLGWGEVALAMGTGLLQGCQGPGLRKSEPERFVPTEIGLVAPPSAPVEEVQQNAHRAAIEGQAVSLDRELVNLPPCDLYPETFATRAQQVAAAVGVDCTVLDENQLAAEQMGALGRGPRLGSAAAPGRAALPARDQRPNPGTDRQRRDV